IAGVARFTHALEDLLLLAEQSNALADPVLVDALGDSADTLAGMVDAVAGLAAPPPDMTAVYRSLLEWLDRLPVADEAAEAALAGSARDEVATGLPPEGLPEAADDGAPAALSGAPAPVAPSWKGSPSADGEPVLRVPGGLVDRLVDASTEAVIAVAQVHERLEELGRIRRAIRLGAQRAQDLALEAERLVDALRRLAPPDSTRATTHGDATADREEADALGLARHDDLDRLSGRIAEVGADGLDRKS